MGATALTSTLVPVAAVEDSELHGISTFGDLKYAPGFSQFDYVNADAPKGGMFSHVSPGAIFNQNLHIQFFEQLYT